MSYNNVRVTQDYHHQGVREGTLFNGGWGGKGSSFLFISSAFVFFVGLLLGMCESVRTRNTLHIVGARKSSIYYNAVEGR